MSEFRATLVTPLLGPLAHFGRATAAARRLVCRTLYGEFRLDAATGLQVGHGVLTVQWQGGKRRIVWPAKSAERPLVYTRS